MKLHDAFSKLRLRRAACLTCACIMSLAYLPASAFAASDAGTANANQAATNAADGVSADNDGTDSPTADGDTTDGSQEGDGGADTPSNPETPTTPDDPDTPTDPDSISIDGAKVKLSTTSVLYKGSDTERPTVKSVKLAGGGTLSAKHYSVTYSNAKKAGTATVTVKGKGKYTGSATAAYSIYSASIKYKTKGGSYVKQGKACSASTLKKIKIVPTLTAISGKVKYKVNLADDGWQSYVANGEAAATGIIRALRVKLTGDLADAYDVYYRVKVDKLGWLGWAKNAENAGSYDMHLNATAFKVKLVAKGEEAPSQNGYAYVSKSDNYVAAVNTILDDVAKETTASSSYLILCSKTYNRLNIYKKDNNGSWQRVKSWKCSTGKKSTQSLSGTFYVGARGYSFDTSGNDGTCYYWTQWSGNYLFHSVIYKLHDPNTIKYGNQLGRNISHGCVRLDKANAKWIYDNIPSGTKVKVFGTVY